jgi:hypothetical protein
VLTTVKCPQCGAGIELPKEGSLIKCQHCGSQIYAQDVFDKLEGLLKYSHTLRVASCESPVVRESSLHPGASERDDSREEVDDEHRSPDDGGDRHGDPELGLGGLVGEHHATEDYPGEPPGEGHQDEVSFADPVEPDHGRDLVGEHGEGAKERKHEEILEERSLREEGC